MKHLSNILIALGVLVLASGCIKENREECDNCTIKLQYFADGYSDVLTSYINEVDLYIYDQDGQLVTVIPSSKDELDRNNNSLSTKLNAGTYQLVAIGNTGSQSNYNDVESRLGTKASFLDDIFVEPKPVELRGEEVVTGIDHLYLGDSEFTVKAQKEHNRDTVTMHCAHLNLKVRVRGLPAPTKAEEQEIFFLELAQTNTKTLASNRIVPSEKGTMYPQLKYDPTTGYYVTEDLAIMRLDLDKQITQTTCMEILSLDDTYGMEWKATEDVWGYIMRNVDIKDLTKEEAELAIDIIYYPTHIEIKPPTWQVENVKPEF